MIGIDLNLLVALDALLTERNVTRAAERLSIGQSAMSAALGRLRKHFGDPLLVRTGRSMVATPFAESLVEPVREAMKSIALALGQPKHFDPTTDRRTFTVMASDYVTLILLRPLLARLSIETPLQQINVVPVARDFADQLRAELVDMVIVPGEVTDAQLDLHQRSLFEDRYVLVADADNDAVDESLSVEAFSMLPYVGYSGGTLPSIAEAQLNALGIRRRVEMGTQSFAVTPFLITGTPFVSLVHERLARHVAAAARLKVVEPPMPMRPITEALFWNPRRRDDEAHAWLRHRIGDQAAALEASN